MSQNHQSGMTTTMSRMTSKTQKQWVLALNLHRFFVVALLKMIQRIIYKRKWCQLNHQHGTKRTKARNRIYDRVYGLHVMAQYSDMEFQRMFRLDRTGFASLLIQIKPCCVVKNTTKSANSSGSSINPVTKLGAALGGWLVDLIWTFVGCLD